MRLATDRSNQMLVCRGLCEGRQRAVRGREIIGKSGFSLVMRFFVQRKKMTPRLQLLQVGIGGGKEHGPAPFARTN